MKKLSLQIESLEVESFVAAVDAADARGTVRANGVTNELQEEQQQVDGVTAAWWRCITITCICGASEKELCSAGCIG